MMNMKQMRAAALRELERHLINREKLREFEMRGLRARVQPLAWRKGAHADPTAQEAVLHLEPPPAVREMRDWVWAVESAYGMLEKSEPEKARLMERYFGLKEPVLYRSAPRRRALLIAAELGISEPTFYKWREDCVLAVVSAAIQAGLLIPYDTRGEKRRSG